MLSSGFAAEKLNTFLSNLSDTTVRESLEKQGRSGGRFEAVHQQQNCCAASEVRLAACSRISSALSSSCA